MIQVETKHHAFVRTVALVFLLAAASVPLFAQHVQQGEDGRIIPQAGDMRMSPEEQIALGERVGARIRLKLPLLPDSHPVSKFVQSMGHRLAEKAPGYAWPYRFHVLASKEVNAFALPGGNIYVNLGTIQTTSESELASVIAHEIGHVVLQHTAREVGKRKTARTMGVVGSVALGATLGPVGGLLASEALQLGTNAFVLKYSREDESEADLLAAQIMYDANYDPFASPEFFQRMADQNGRPIAFLSDHPSAGARAENVGQAIQKFPPKSYSKIDSEGFRAAKRLADSIRTFDAEEIARHTGVWNFDSTANPALSATLDNLRFEQVRPLGDWAKQEQSGLTFSCPGNWEVTRSGTKTVVAPHGAVSRAGAIAYGLSIQPAAERQLNEASRTAALAVVREFPGTTIISVPDHLTVSGREAVAYELAGDSPIHAGAKPLREHKWLVTVQRSDSTFLNLLFVAPERDYSALKETYRRILGSVHLD